MQAMAQVEGLTVFVVGLLALARFGGQFPPQLMLQQRALGVMSYDRKLVDQERCLDI